jgi:hypothetical protein
MRSEDTRAPAALVAAIITRAGKIALLAAGPERWQTTLGYTLVPIELPGGPVEADETPAGALTRHCARLVGGVVRARSSRTTYGPSPAHRIDRLTRDNDEAPYPLLRYTRGTILGAEGNASVATAIIRAYLATEDDAPTPSERLAGLLWLTPEALRVAVRGVPFAEVGGLVGEAAWLAGAFHPLPDDAFIYVPGDFGERHLLRVVAKYGRRALECEGEGHEPGV